MRTLCAVNKYEVYKMKNKFLRLTQKQYKIFTNYQRRMRWIASKNFPQQKRYIISKDITNRYYEQMEGLFKELQQFYFTLEKHENHNPF